MSLAPFHPSLRARVSEALADVLLDNKARALGRQLGHAGHTITERGADLARWSLIDALMLAAEHDGLRGALIACLQGADQRKAGESTAAFGELLHLFQRDATVHADVAVMLRDGNVSISDARQALHAVMARRSDEDRTLLPALAACISPEANA